MAKYLEKVERNRRDSLDHGFCFGSNWHKNLSVESSYPVP